jgi:hypothetical protein
MYPTSIEIVANICATEHLLRKLPRLRIPSRIMTNNPQPANGSQKLIEVEDEKKLRVFMDKRYAHRRRIIHRKLELIQSPQNGR